MSNFDELIRELCPNGVEHYELRNIAHYSNTRVNASVLDESNFVGVDNLLPNKAGKINAQYLPNTTRLTAYYSGDVLLGNIRPYLQKIWLANKSGGCSGDVLAIRVAEAYRPYVLPEFLYYVLSSDSFFAFDMKHAKGAKMPRGNKEAIMNFVVPVPPLPVQREIVRILDMFTQLEAELEAELEARRQQSGYYRELLITPDASTPWFEVGDLCEVNRGRVMSKDYLAANPGAYPVYSSQTANNGIFGYINSFDYQTESVTWTTDGANAGSVFYHNSFEKFSITNVCGILKNNGKYELSTKYLYYCLSIYAKSYVSTGMGNPKLMSTAMKRIKVPVPTLREQERIVNILDKFSVFAHDLNAGLPAEIVARRKQYEHYRDKLLAFKELFA